MYCKYHVEEQENKKENIKDAQKDDTLQPITKVNSKLDKELQEWEVESTKGGANDGGGWEEKEKWSPNTRDRNECKKIRVYIIKQIS